ncbi:MAG: hypothetical protein AAGA90_17150 [Actinomycetota bacterium]
MIGGGTSPWPAWGLWLTAAIALAVVLVFLTCFVGLTKGFGRFSKRRVILGLWLIATLVGWGGYRVVSNNRWAARSVVVNVLDALPPGVYEVTRGIRVATEDDACSNGAVASARAWRIDPATDYREIGSTELEAELELFETIASNLEAAGYDIERGVSESYGSTHALVALAVRSDRYAHLTFGAGGLLARTAGNACNGEQHEAWFRRDVDDIIDRFDLEHVCAAKTPSQPFPTVCD